MFYQPTGESHKELVCMGKCIRDTHDEIFKVCPFDYYSQ